MYTKMRMSNRNMCCSHHIKGFKAFYIEINIFVNIALFERTFRTV